MTNKVQKILSEIATRKLCTMDEHMAFYNDKAKEDYRFLSEIEELIKALQEEPVSEDLDEAAKADAMIERPDDTEVGYDLNRYGGFISGAQWREDQMMKKAVDADCFGFHGAALFSFRSPSYNYLIGSKVKVIVIKED